MNLKTAVKIKLSRHNDFRKADLLYVNSLRSFSMYQGGGGECCINSYLRAVLLSNSVCLNRTEHILN